MMAHLKPVEVSKGSLATAWYRGTRGGFLHLPGWSCKVAAVHSVHSTQREVDVYYCGAKWTFLTLGVSCTRRKQRVRLKCLHVPKHWLICVTNSASEQA